jgi:hypothetical protein
MRAVEKKVVVLREIRENRDFRRLFTDFIAIIEMALLNGPSSWSQEAVEVLDGATSLPSLRRDHLIRLVGRLLWLPV